MNRQTGDLIRCHFIFKRKVGYEQQLQSDSGTNTSVYLHKSAGVSGWLVNMSVLPLVPFLTQ
jgi:hypothetical protein